MQYQQEMNIPYTIGVDVGATKIAAGLVRGGKVIKKISVIHGPEVQSKKTGLLTVIDKTIESIWRPEVVGIGLGLAGVTDQQKGIFLNGANFPTTFRNINFPVSFKKYGCPIQIDNDVNAFALGEALYGAGREHGLVFGLTLGTGVGGALIVDGSVFHGRDNSTGEVGHMIIQMEGGAPCGPKQSGHLESYVSGTALQHQITERFSKPVEPKDLDGLVLSGNRQATEIIELAGRALAVGLANIIQTINPDIIIVGGGLSRMQTLWKVCKRQYKDLVTYRQPRSTPVVISKLQNDANILGAARLTLMG